MFLSLSKLVSVEPVQFFSGMDHSKGQDAAAPAAGAVPPLPAADAHVAGVVPPLPAADADAAAFQPQGVAIHLNPMASRPKFRVQVRLGNGPDCPIVQPPATLWFGTDGRLKAVATPMTTSEADDLEFDDNEPIDVDGDDDEEDDDNEEINLDNSSCNGDVAGHHDDDDDVVYLGEFKNSAQA